MPAFDEEEEECTFVQTHKGLVIAGALLLVGAGIVFATRLMHRENQISQRQIPPGVIWIPPVPKSTPAPTPLATPTPVETPQQKMIAVTPTDNGSTRAPISPKPVTAPPGPNISTNIPGPNGTLPVGPGDGIPGSGDGPGQYGSKYGQYLNGVQQRISDALRNNPRTRKSSMNVIVRIWPDASGRIARTTISGDAIDAALRDAIQNGVLAGLQLNEPPPADMPLPIVMRLSAQRP